VKVQNSEYFNNARAFLQSSKTFICKQSTKNFIKRVVTLCTPTFFDGDYQLLGAISIQKYNLHTWDKNVQKLNYRWNRRFIKIYQR
jgi:maltooligosyltrehalose synthase